jgi:glycosyltransferase involved in cell wall biosynthesis
MHQLVKNVLSMIIASHGVNRAKGVYAAARGIWLGEYAAAQGIDHIHCHWAGSTATMAMVASAVSGIPWSLTAHRWDIAANDNFDKKARSASFVRIISRSGQAMASKLSPAANQAIVLHMGVRVPDESPIARGRSPLVFLCPANLVPVKGHCYLLSAVRMLREQRIECSLRIVGDGELRRSLGYQAYELGLGDCVRFLGAMPHEQLLQLYRDAAADVVVLPSLDLGNGLQEGIPVSLMEAMSYSVPVISTNTGGVPELVERGAGLLVPPARPDLLAQAMLSMIQSPDLRRQLGIAGRERVEKSFSVVSVARQLTSLFERHSARNGVRANQAVQHCL